MLAEVGRAQEALLFGGDGGEVDGALWRRFRVSPHAGHFEKQSASGRVVDCAVVNRVTAIVSATDAEMIVMSRVEDPLVAQFRIAAGEFGHDIRGVERANLAGD